MTDQIGRLSPDATKAVQERDINEVFLTALDISHEDMAENLHVINNTENLQRLGKTYIALPFNVDLPDEGGDDMPRVDLTLANYTDEEGNNPVSDAIEKVSSSPQFTLSVFSASRPDVTEFGPLRLELMDASYDQGDVRGTLAVDPHLTREPHPKDSFDASIAPNIFARRV